MPDRLDTIGNFLVGIIPELILTIFAGTTILVIEYKTGWFANNRSLTKQTDEDENKQPVERVTPTPER